MMIDGPIIFFYRIFGIPIADYMFGTFVLSMITVVIGELTVSLALKANKPYLAGLSRTMKQKESLSINAYENGDMTGYKALNKQATDAWGKKFWLMLCFRVFFLHSVITH